MENSENEVGKLPWRKTRTLFLMCGLTMPVLGCLEGDFSSPVNLNANVDTYAERVAKCIGVPEGEVYAANGEVKSEYAAKYERECRFSDDNRDSNEESGGYDPDSHGI